LRDGISKFGSLCIHNELHNTCVQKNYMYIQSQFHMRTHHACPAMAAISMATDRYIIFAVNLLDKWSVIKAHLAVEMHVERCRAVSDWLVQRLAVYCSLCTTSANMYTHLPFHYQHQCPVGHSRVQLAPAYSSTPFHIRFAGDGSHRRRTVPRQSVSADRISRNPAEPSRNGGGWTCMHWSRVPTARQQWRIDLTAILANSWADREGSVDRDEVWGSFSPLPAEDEVWGGDRPNWNFHLEWCVL